jgi:hypothetical protein
MVKKTDPEKVQTRGDLPGVPANPKYEGPSVINTARPKSVIYVRKVGDMSGRRRVEGV